MEEKRPLGAAKEREEHVVGDLSDFPEGGHRLVKVGRREIGVFNVGGALYGLPNVCPHQTGPLCEGKPALGTLVANAEGGLEVPERHPPLLRGGRGRR